MTNRWAVLALIMAAQTMANVGPLGLPSIAPLIREGLDLSVTQAGSFLSAYYIGPVLMSLPAGWLADRWGVRGAMTGRSAPPPRRLHSATLTGPPPAARLPGPS